jgi:DNA gyrase subunit B
LEEAAGDEDFAADSNGDAAVDGNGDKPRKRSARGGKVNSDFDITRLRYNRIILMADADVDGSHIRTLAAHVPVSLHEAAGRSRHIYIAKPPLYSIRKGKQSNTPIPTRARPHYQSESR